MKMNFVGLDTHKRFTYGIIKDKEGNILAEDRFDNGEKQFNKFLSGYDPKETKIVMESTGVWEWIYELLDDKKYKVILANPLKTKAIASAKIKTDKIDASILADLLRANLIAESYVPPKEIRKLRELARQRNTLVKGRTQISNKMHSLSTQNGLTLPWTCLCKKAISWLDELSEEHPQLKSYVNLHIADQQSLSAILLLRYLVNQ